MSVLDTFYQDDANQFAAAIGEPLPHHVAGKRHRYSLFKALRQADPTNRRDERLDGLELEVHQELQRRHAAVHLSRQANSQMGSVLVPFDQLATRAALTTTTGAGAIGEPRGEPWIASLRARSVVGKLGGAFIDGVVGSFALPKFTAGENTTWKAETEDPSGGNATTIGMVPFEMKSAIAWLNVTRTFLKTTSPTAEAQLKGDLTASLGVAIDRAGLAGTGEDNEPEGLLYKSTIPVLSIGDDGGPITWDHLVQLERTAELDDAILGPPAYVSSPKGQYELKTTQKVAGKEKMLLEGGKVNDHPFLASGSVPSDLSKGYGSNLTALIFGDFSQLLTTIWGQGVEIVLNPFVLDIQGIVRITTVLFADVNVRNPESFCLIKDMTTTAVD